MQNERFGCIMQKRDEKNLLHCQKEDLLFKSVLISN